MAITPLSNLSLQTIANEFGGATPHSISEYYLNNGLIPTIRRNVTRIPASPEPISFSNFSGTAREFSFQTAYQGGPGTVTINVATGYYKTIFICGVTQTLPIGSTVNTIPLPTITSPISSGFTALRTGPEQPSTNTRANATLNGYSNWTYDPAVSSITISLPAAFSDYFIVAGYNAEPNYAADLPFFTTRQYIAAFEVSNSSEDIILGPGGGVANLPLTGPSGIGYTSINVVLVSAIRTYLERGIPELDISYSLDGKLISGLDTTNTGSGTTTYSIPGITLQAAAIIFRI